MEQTHYISGDIFLEDVTSNDIYQFLKDRLETDRKPWSQQYATVRAKNVLWEIFGLARTLTLMSGANPVLGLDSLPRLSPRRFLNGVWPAGLSQFFTGRKLPRDSDTPYIRLQGSEIDYGHGFDAANILGHVKQIAYLDVTLPPAYSSWLERRDASKTKTLKKKSIMR